MNLEIIQTGAALAAEVRGLDLSKKRSWLLTVAVPRGLAAGVLSAIPVSYSIGGPDFPPAIFSLIVTSIVVFCFGVALVTRMPDEADTSARVRA